MCCDVVSHLVMHSRHTMFPQSNSIGLSGMSVHILHVILVGVVCIVGVVVERGSVGNRDAGASAVSLVTISL